MAKNRIQIVEDENIFAKDLQSQLESLEYDVVALCSSGEDAISKAGECKPDLVLMDIQLRGEIDGVEAAQKIRASYKIPVVYLTAYSDENTLQRAKITEPFGYLLKPFNSNELNAIIQMSIYKHDMELRLKESEQWLSTTLRGIGDGVIATNAEGEIKFMNAVAESLIGWSQKEAIGKPMAEVFKIFESEKKPANTVKLIQRRGRYRFNENTLLATKNNGRIPVESNGSLIRDERGEKMGVVLIFRDITERKQAEQERQRLATAIEQAAECVVITDTDTRIVYVNPVFERITGYTREEVVGQKPSILKSGEQDESFYRNMWKILKSGKVWSGVFFNKKKDGTIYEEEATISPIRDVNGSITNYVAVKIDVTEKRRLERQLRQAQKMEAMGTLAGGIAHDFNNILAGILGYTELSLYEAEEGSKLWRNLDQIFKAVLRARDLVKQILAFTRQVEQERHPVRINVITKEVIKLLRASLPANIEIQQNISEKIGVVLADPTQIHQVLMNLCTNASHAMREKGGVLEIGTSPFFLDEHSEKNYNNLKPGEYVKLSVSDSGHGMTKKVLDRIFDPYFTTKRVDEGTGMGLAVVQGIVKGLGGEVMVYSEAGVGTSFNIYFPVTQGSGGVTANRRRAELPRGNERILLVDDEQALVDSGTEILGQLGYTVISTTSALEALDLFNATPDKFDLVITDQTMPKMTGDELVRLILKKRPDLPIILCTGFSQTIDPHRIKQLGVREFITKPIVSNEIAAAIRRLLDEAESEK